MSIPDVTKTESHRSSLNEARALASLVIAQTPSSEFFDAAAILEQYPEFRDHKSIVVDLAYEEYCRRTEAGELVDPQEFADRFPQHARSLFKVVQVYNFFKDDEQFVKHARLDWPISGDDFLGFQLHEELGRGAFSRVFAASERALGNRKVVVKICTNGNLEAQTLGQLEHPHIVPVFSVRQDSETGLTAICMPFLGRTTLHDVLHAIPQQAGWPASGQAIAKVVSDQDPSGKPANGAVWARSSYVDSITRIAVQLAEAMAYTHTEAICHSDIKPSNVLLTTDGRAMLFDFNLAFAQQVAGANVGGTVPYMAPEQLQAVVDARRDREVPIDARTDVFSFGVTIYEMLCGQMPFGRIPEHESNRQIAAELLERQQAGPIPLISHNPHVSARLAEIVEQCLAFNPAERPQSASEVAEALRAELTLPARLRRFVRGHRLQSLTTAVAALILLIGVTTYLATRESPDARLFRLGAEAYQEKNYGQATLHFTALLEEQPNNVNALFARGRAHMKGRDFAAALQDFREVEKLLPDYGDGRVTACIGYCLAKEAIKKVGKSADYDAAAKAFARSRTQPNAIPAGILDNNIGFCDRKCGHIQRAIRLFESAISLDPTLQAPLYNLAEIDEATANRLKQMPETEYIRRAAELGPGNDKVYLTAARIFAHAANVARQSNRGDVGEYVQSVVRYAELALEHGAPPNQIARLTWFDPQLDDDPRFHRLRRLPAVPQTEIPREIGLIKPLAGDSVLELK